MEPETGGNPVLPTGVTPKKQVVRLTICRGTVEEERLLKTQ
jgi:hypothetical protein